MPGRIVFDRSHFDSGDQFDGQLSTSVDLDVDDVSHGLTTIAPVITVDTINLIMSNGSHAVTSSNPTVGSFYGLEDQSAFQPLSSTNINLTAIQTLEIQDSILDFTSPQINLRQDIVGSKRILRFDHSHFDGKDQFDGPGSSIFTLDILDDKGRRGFGEGKFGTGTFGYFPADLRISSNQLELRQIGGIHIDDGKHGLSSSSSALTQPSVLAVQSSNHRFISTDASAEGPTGLNVSQVTHILQSPSLDVSQSNHIHVDSTGHSVGSSELAIQTEGDQDVPDATHGLISSSPDLIQGYILNVANSRHVVDSSSIELGRIAPLVMNDANHRLIISNVSIHSTQDLSVSDANHQVVSTSPVPVVVTILVPAGCSHRFISSSPFFTQIHILNTSNSLSVVRSTFIRFDDIAGYPWVYVNGFWRPCPVKVWDGSQWREVPLKRWDENELEWVLV